MTDRSRWTDDERNLATRLRREAAQSSPEFSPELHARVMDAAHQSQREATSHHSRARWIGLTALAAAAVIALVIGAWIMSADRSVVRDAPQENPRFPEKVDFVFLPHFSASQLHTVQQRMDEQRLAYLDRDAKRLASFVVDQLSSTLPPDRAPIQQ